MRPGIESSVNWITGAGRPEQPTTPSMSSAASARSATTSRSPRAGRAESVLEDITFPLAVGSIAPRSDIRDKAPRISGERAAPHWDLPRMTPRTRTKPVLVFVLVFVLVLVLVLVFVCGFRSGFRFVGEFQRFALLQLQLARLRRLFVRRVGAAGVLRAIAA